MFCRHCGTKLVDQAVFCTACGKPVAEEPPQAAEPTYPQPIPVTVDSGSYGWWALGFFFPLVGLILFLAWKDQKPLTAKRAGIGALVGAIVSVVLFVLVFGLLFGFLGMALASSWEDPWYYSDSARIFPLWL